MSAQDVTRSASTSARAFVRRSSGLVRTFSLADVAIINVLCISPGLVLLFGPWFTAYLWPGANLLVSMLIGAVLVGFGAFFYGQFAAAMPRSGGEYVYISRTMHPALGFVMSWGMTWNFLVGAGLWVSMLIAWAVAPTLAVLGLNTGSATITGLSEALATPLWTLIVSIAVLAIIALVLLLGSKVLRTVLRVLFVIGSLGMLATMVMLIATPHESFVNAFNSYLASYNNNPDTYNLVFQQAKDNGWAPSAFSWAAVLMALPYGYWMFEAFQYSVYAGGEVKEPQKSQPYGIMLAFLIGLFFEGVIVQLSYNTFGWDFIHASGFLDNTVGAPMPVSPMLPFFLGVLTTNNVVNILMGITFFAWVFGLLLLVAFLPVRNLFAWSFDRLLPEGVTKTTKNGTPWVATVIVILVTIAMVGLAMFTGVVDQMINTMIILAIVFFVTSIAGIVFPFVKKDMFEAAPRVVNFRVGGIPFLTIAASISAATFGFITYACIATPAFSGPTGWESWVFLIGMFGSGALVYYGMRAFRKSQGIDVDLNWQEIPPE